MADTDELTDDALTSTFRVLQRRAGHRYSIDDVATAWAAATARPDASRALDLGTGIGSVALMLAHALPSAALVAVEAQDVSFELLRKNIARNGLEARVLPHRGDLRDVALLDRLGCFELVTGTPPYFPVGTATIPPDSQKAHARHELRGGIEAYVEAVARTLAPGGLAVLCGDARRPERVTTTASAHGLFVRTIRPLVPRAGKDALFSLFEIVREECTTEHAPPLVLRDAEGARTATERTIRGFFGLAAGPEAPSPPERPRRSR